MSVDPDLKSGRCLERLCHTETAAGVCAKRHEGTNKTWVRYSNANIDVSQIVFTRLAEAGLAVPGKYQACHQYVSLVGGYGIYVLSSTWPILV